MERRERLQQLMELKPGMRVMIHFDEKKGYTIKPHKAKKRKKVVSRRVHPRPPRDSYRTPPDEEVSVTSSLHEVSVPRAGCPW